MDAIAGFWKSFKLHLILVFLIIALWPLSEVFHYKVSSFYSEIVPRIFRGKSLIVESAGWEFYYLCGFVSFYNLLLLFIFSIFNFITLAKYRIKFRNLKYQIKETAISRIIIVLILHHFLIYYFGFPKIYGYGRFYEIYNGNFYLGLIFPSLINPVGLLALYSLLVVQFLILSKKNK